MTQATRRQAGSIAAAVVAAGLVHAVAGRHLAAADPIAALRGPSHAGAIVAAVGLIVARLFLYLVAPGWAACFVARCIAVTCKASRSG